MNEILTNFLHIYSIERRLFIDSFLSINRRRDREIGIVLQHSVLSSRSHISIEKNLFADLLCGISETKITMLHLSF